MEQDCIRGIYRSLGLSVGAKFSPADVSDLFSKVFHVPSSTDAAHVAMEKIAGDDSGWCCAGENVLDVLLEMEKEREKKDKLYWDLQLLNLGNLTNEPVVNDPLIKNTLHQKAELSTLRKSHSQSEREPLHPDTCDTDNQQRGRLMGNNELYGSVRAVRKLKKASRQSWVRLASEGVQSILPHPTLGESLGSGCQVWGFLSLSEVLLFLEVKYDVVTHLFYTEMLQEHYTLSIWETLTPKQQQQEEEELEGLVEEALESGDVLCLAELPGAFRIYRAYQGPALKNHPETREESWSAVSFLYELQTCRQQEKDALAALGPRLDREDLRLMCLFIRLATLRAQRENLSYKALLAARQSWEAWPCVTTPCRAELAALWLHEEEEKPKKDFISASPQQAALQLLVLTQEQQRKHLIKLLHSVSMESLQEPGCTMPQKEESQEQTSFRNDCMTRLRQIRADLQTHKESPNSQPQLQMDHISSELEMWSKPQLEGCSLLLLIQVMELQEVQATKLLPALMDKSAQSVQALRDKLESQLREQCFTLKLLVSEVPSTLGSSLSPEENLIEKSSNEQMKALSSCRGAADAENSSGGSAETLTVDPIRGGGGEVHAGQAADETNKQDICAGCGAMMEDLPYLEILCVSDTTNNPQQCKQVAEEEKEEAGAMESTQNFEKQGSLITLAWSKPPDDDTDCEADAAEENTGQSQDAGSSLTTQVCQSHVAEDLTQFEQVYKETDLPDSQVTAKGTASANQPEQREAVSQFDLSAHHYIDPPVIEQISVDLCSALTSKAVHVDGAGVEVETCPTETASEMWKLEGTELTNSEEQDSDSAASVERDSVLKEKSRASSMMEREQAMEPVSAVERERTMRNLVDMQRKVEQRQQRDRERQLLRVQERLTIIQHRKAEEDLLGLKGTDRLKHLTQDLPPEDKNQQKTVVRERLEQVRRERSYIMQSKRERNTAGFKELLGPVALPCRKPDDEAD